MARSEAEREKERAEKGSEREIDNYEVEVMVVSSMTARHQTCY